MSLLRKSIFLQSMQYIQKHVRRYPTIVQAVRTTRNLIHFGPWRSIALQYLRLISPRNDTTGDHTPSTMGLSDLPSALHSLNCEGYSLGFQISPAIVERSTDYWANKSPGVYVDAHLQSHALACIASDPEILRLSRAYFCCDYNMIECKLFISEKNQTDRLTSAYHFDHCGVKSLNVIIYLNSVSEETGPHVLVARTHRKKKIRDYFREYTPIEEIEHRFPEQIRTITGPPGTVLFENPEVFHRRLVAQRRRVAMIIVFSTNGRRLLSTGREYSL